MQTSASQICKAKFTKELLFYLILQQKNTNVQNMGIRIALTNVFIIFALFVFFSFPNLVYGQNNQAKSYEDYTAKSKLQYKNGNYKKAIEFATEALKKAEYQNDSTRIANTLHQLGSYYAAWDKFSIAIDYYYKAKDYRVALNDSLWLAHELNDIGYAYLYWEDYELVIDYYKQALQIYKALNNMHEIALAEANIGFAYSFWGNQGEAIKHHTKSFAIYKQLKDTCNFSKMYHGIGDAERRRGNTDIASELLNLAVFYSIKCNNKIQQGTNYLRLAEVSTAMGKYSQADEYFKKCWPFFESRNSGKWIKNYYYARYEFFLSQNKYKQALTAFQRFKTYQDSLFNKRLQSEIMEIKIINDTQEKERNILLLKTENEISKREISGQRKLLFSVVTALFIISTLLVLLYKKNKSRKEAYLSLVEKNSLLIKKEIEYREKLKLNKKKNKSSSSIVGNEERDRILKLLQKLMNEKKIFLKHGLKLNDVCKKLKTNSSYLSNIINQEFGKSFNNYVNDYRIREAQQLILNDEHQVLNLEGIAQKVGFTNRMTFTIAFKKMTGVPPSIYINLTRKKQH